MKRFLKLLFIVLHLLLLIMGSCKKESAYMNDAIITGSDARACICCGGLMITFNGETRPYIGDFKLIANDSDIPMFAKNKFPVYVKVDWKSDTTNVCNRIIITRITRK